MPTGLPPERNATLTSRFDDYDLHVDLAARAMPDADAHAIEATARQTYDAWCRHRQLPWTGKDAGLD